MPPRGYGLCNVVVFIALKSLGLHIIHIFWLTGMLVWQISLIYMHKT